ncbi:MAG: dihydroneopterin aldolase [Alkalispirochaetaceae bacterium]
MKRVTVGLRELELRCILGIKEEERLREQRVLVDLAFDYDGEAASRRDDIREAIDYARVVAMVREHLIRQKYKLLEAACAGIIGMLQDAYPLLLTIEIEVRKPDAFEDVGESYCRMAWKVPGSPKSGTP